MKKTYVAGSLMLVMALMMAGCGGGDKKPDALSQAPAKLKPKSSPKQKAARLQLT